MPYSITRYAEDLVWVEMDGQLAVHHAECYFVEMWALLDANTRPLDLLVDGRRIVGAAPGARRRTEQIAHHPNLGQLAFVVSEHHLLLFAPLVKLVSGVGLFGDTHEALSYLHATRGRPLPDHLLRDLPPPPPHGDRELVVRNTVRPLPLPPASRQKQTPLYRPPDAQGSADGSTP
jgi:hypothetical protein